SRDAIFDENRFFSIPRPKDIIPNSDESQRDDLFDDVPNEIPRPRKEAIDDEIGSIMENITWVLSDLPPGCKPLGSIGNPRLRQKKGIDYFNTYAPVARITTIRLLLALAAIHNLVMHQMDFRTTFLNDSSSTSRWVFLLGRGAISWASKKQTCITSSTIEYEFVALATAGKEAEWLRNLIHEILI
nr:zinc finger, CCHC-type [Tanacetum cinerariifolium]